MTLGCIYFPHRYLVVFMMFLTVVVIDVIRTSLKLTFNKIAKSSPNHLDECSASVKRFGEHIQEQVVDSFNYAYIISNILAVMLVKLIGGKLAVGISVFLIGVLTILLPIAACNSSIYSLFVIRISMGLLMGVTVLGLLQLGKNWTPLNERTLFVATATAGSPVGTLIAWIMTTGNSNNLLDLITWQLMYKILGVVGIVWSLLWIALSYEEPTQHPYISQVELDYLMKSVPKTYRKAPTPWLAILKSKPFWALIVAYMGHEYGFYSTIDYLQMFYHDVSQLSNSQNRDLSVAGFILIYLGIILLGFLCDKIISLKWTTATHLRRLITAIAAVGPGIGTVCASYLSDHVSQVIINTSFIACTGLAIITLNVNPLDLSYNNAVVILAITNGSGTVAGVISSIVVEAILNRENPYNCLDDTLIKWQDISWIKFAVQVISYLPFLMCGSGQVQHWDKPKALNSCSVKNQLKTCVTMGDEEDNNTKT